MSVNNKSATVTLRPFHLAGFQTARADIHALGTACGLDRDLVYVRMPDPVGSPVRMADICAEMYTLAAYLTFGHDDTYLLDILTFITPYDTAPLKTQLLILPQHI